MPRRNKQIKHIKLAQIDNCRPKRQYLNKRQAKDTAEYQMLINPNLELAVYQCDICLKWHLKTKNIHDNY